MPVLLQQKHLGSSNCLAKSKDYPRKNIFSNKDLEWICNVGGEFYFDKDIQKDLIGIRDRCGVKLQVLTNGSLYDPTVPVDGIVLTLHAFNEQGFLQECRVNKDTYLTWKKNFYLLRETPKVTEVIVLLNTYNICNPNLLLDFIINNIPKDKIIRLSNEIDSRGKCYLMNSGRRLSTFHMIDDALKQEKYALVYNREVLPYVK